VDRSDPAGKVVAPVICRLGRVEQREGRNFRIDLSLAIATSERLLIAVGRSKVAIPVSRPSRPFSRV
jgi:hypothetical protein